MVSIAILTLSSALSKFIENGEANAIHQLVAAAQLPRSGGQDRWKGQQGELDQERQPVAAEVLMLDETVADDR